MLTWMEEIKKKSVTFLKTDNVILNLSHSERRKNKNRNYIEAAVCSMIVDNFNHCGVKPDTITVITPYLDQQNLL